MLSAASVLFQAGPLLNSIITFRRKNNLVLGCNWLPRRAVSHIFGSDKSTLASFCRRATLVGGLKSDCWVTSCINLLASSPHSPLFHSASQNPAVMPHKR